MAKQVSKKFTWVIKNFSLQSEMYYSAPILIGDNEWHLLIDPKEDNANSLYMGLEVAGSKSLPSGWRRYVNLRLSVAKIYKGELSLLNEMHLWFDQTKLGWDFPTSVPPTKLLDEKKGFLVNGQLTIVAEVEVLEVVGTYYCSKEYEGSYQIDDCPKPCDLLNQSQETMEVNGFQVLPSQVVSVKRIFERHPDIALGLRSKNQHHRKTSMSFLLSLIETLCQSLQDLSDEDLVDADIALTYLKDVGLKVDWLERKLDQVKEKKYKEESSLGRLLNLRQNYSYLDALVEKEEAELFAIRTPLSFDDVV